uniref:Uncharacterized protein n=1 Tax=Pseudomonas aeruginosa TaxID=287 RepID=A0A2L1KGQ8_PSEAI|nr:Hypothetical protein [Pseudomonas aeruginosa]QNI16064.1 Hypothetical protein [Pseudomonas aeruginosa]
MFCFRPVYRGRRLPPAFRKIIARGPRNPEEVAIVSPRLMGALMKFRSTLLNRLKPTSSASQPCFPRRSIKPCRPEITISHPMRWGVALGYRHSPGLTRGHSVMEVDMLDPCFHLDPEVEGFAGMPFR